MGRGRASARGHGVHGGRHRLPGRRPGPQEGRHGRGCYWCALADARGRGDLCRGHLGEHVDTSRRLAGPPAHLGPGLICSRSPSVP
ncbi:hypothetical protein [Ornithinimicrobium kibberense]|uniref:hypothetical protein n=1 Tax=Ornithinimicrobium kibberense TaxID=282060 RepID=UPI0036110BA7